MDTGIESTMYWAVYEMFIGLCMSSATVHRGGEAGIEIALGSDLRVAIEDGRKLN